MIDQIKTMTSNLNGKDQELDHLRSSFVELTSSDVKTKKIEEERKSELEKLKDTISAQEKEIEDLKNKLKGAERDLAQAEQDLMGVSAIKADLDLLQSKCDGTIQSLNQVE